MRDIAPNNALNLVIAQFREITTYNNQDLVLKVKLDR